MLVSAIQQSDSAICINISLPLEPSSHPSRSPQSIPELYSSSSLAIYFTHDGVYISLNSSHPILPPAAAAAAKSLQSCPTLCDPIDGGPPGSPVPGILQARTLEWVAISFSNAWQWKVKVKLLSCVRLLATPWTAAYQAPPPMGFSRQEYWSGVPLPSPILPPSWVLFPQRQHTVGRDVCGGWGWRAEGKGWNTIHPGLSSLLRFYLVPESWG